MAGVNVTRSFLHNVRVAYNVAAEQTSISGLYFHKPGWSEPKLYLKHETRYNGRLIHNLPWAAAQSFTWSTRLLGIPVGVVTSAANIVAMPVVGTATGVVGAALAGVNNVRRRDHKGTRALRRGFVKGYTVGSLSLGLAELVAWAPVMVAQAVVGVAGAVALTLPVRAIGATLDH